MTVQQIINHPLFLYIVVSVVVAEAIKFVTKSLEHHKVYPKGLIENGGMPSTHVTTVTALMLGVGLTEGFTSTYFFIAATFALIVFIDAIGLRNHVDQLTALINRMITKRKMKISKATMVTGHTPLEALGGVVVASVVVYLLQVL